MDNGIHFISGLPRAGSTLLSALLRQNPRFYAHISSPIGTLFNGLLKDMSQARETSMFIDNTQREAILRAVVDAYYVRVHPSKLVFDTNRMWCGRLNTLAALYPKTRVICCVRDVPWVLDSIERLIRRNCFELSGIFGFEPGGTVFSRVEGLAGGTGMLGFAWNALREGLASSEAHRLMLLTYETLTADPERAMAAVYDFIGEPCFRHDFQNIVFNEADEFDARLGTPGLHAVGRVVRPNERASVLPPDLFRRYQPDTFWRDPARIPPNIPVI